MSLECRIRPFNPPSKTPKSEDRPDLRKPPTLWVNRAGFEALERAGGAPGTTVRVRVERLQLGEGVEGVETPLCRSATVMPATQDFKADVVKMTRVFMEGVGFHTGDLVRISTEKGPETAAEAVVVEDISGEPALEGLERTFWELGVGEYLSKAPFSSSARVVRLPEFAATTRLTARS